MCAAFLVVLCVQGNEWEEKWGEQYWSGGKVDKWANKWAREGGDIWHEKWGEMYDGHGEASQARQAQRGLPGTTWWWTVLGCAQASPL